MKIGILGADSFLARNFIEYSRDKFPYEFSLYYPMKSEVEPKYPYKYVDFNNIDDICDKVNFDVDYLMIFIGKTGTTDGFLQYEQFINVNEVMLLNLLTAYVKCNSNARLIYPSSRLIYKSSQIKVAENSEIDLKSVYAVTKFASEKYLEIYRKCYGIKYVILYICTPIGTLLDSNGSYGTFKIFEEQARNNKEIVLFGDGSQRKTFTHIHDVCLAFNKIIQAKNIKHDKYNLGGQNLSLLEIAEKIAEDKNVPIKHVEWPKLYKEVDGGSVIFDSSRFDDEFDMEYIKLLENN